MKKTVSEKGRNNMKKTFRAGEGEDVQTGAKTLLELLDYLNGRSNSFLSVTAAVVERIGTMRKST